jgi:dipeptidyl aminopeptidase/acylaminoacyl peptidase
MVKLHKHTQTALQIAVLALLVGGIFGYGIRLFFEPRQQSVAIATPKVSPRLASAGNLAYPITIPAQRSRTYPGGIISSEGDVGIRDGYSLSKISYPSDGYKIYALVATPDSPRPLRGYPVIILAHGYTNPANYRTDGPEYAEYIAAFARRGYLVVKPDFRGYGQSWGTPRGAYFSSDYTADVLNLTASLGNIESADANKVAIWGHSMGGHVALDALTVLPQRFKAAVLASASIGKVEDMYYNWTPPSERANFDAQAEKKRVATLFGDPKQSPTFWDKLSPLNYASSIKTPIQLHHGLSDTVVPSRFSQTAAEMFAAHGVKTVLYTYPKAPHLFIGADRDLLIRRSTDWFDEYMK